MKGESLHIRLCLVERNSVSIPLFLAALLFLDKQELKSTQLSIAYTVMLFGM